MKRRKAEENEECVDSDTRIEESWDSVKELVLSSTTTSSSWKNRLLSFLRSQRDDPKAREHVLKGVDFQFLTKIMASYTATTSKEDLFIYDVLDMLENTYKVNISMLHPIVWGERSVEIYQKRGHFGGTLTRTSPEQVLELLDGKLMWNTVLNHSRRQPETGLAGCKEVKVLYDVRFLLRLFLSMMHAGSELKYRSFVEVNGLALLFSCTSSRDTSIRSLGYCLLQKFLSLLKELDIEAANDPYRNLYYYLLRLLKQSIESDAPRLPHMVSHFFARVSKLILHPESPVFCAVLAFFSLKPVIDLNNVPEMYKLLLSSSTEYHKEEREWILQLISDGLIEPLDYQVLQNRHGMKLLLSMFPTCMVDMTARRLILNILKTAVQMPSVAHDLFYKMNLHTWIASVIKNKDISSWERCYLGQIYAIVVESERNYWRHGKEQESDYKHLVALASVRITSRMVLEVMEDLYEKQTALENIQSIKATLEAKWRKKRKKHDS